MDPPAGAMEAHQFPSPSGSTWLARQPEGLTGKNSGLAAIRIRPEHRPNDAYASGPVHAAATRRDNDKAVEWAIAAKELGFPKQTDGKRMLKAWRGGAGQ